ncbi:hypothetical protein ACFL1Z_01085 [Thermodesulfobacteriota bacterium]
MTLGISACQKYDAYVPIPFNNHNRIAIISINLLLDGNVFLFGGKICFTIPLLMKELLFELKTNHLMDIILDIFEKTGTYFA